MIRLFYMGIMIGIIVGAPLIYGAIKQNRFYLLPSVLFNIIGVFSIPLIYYGIEIRNTRDPLGIAAVWIYTAILIIITVVQALTTLVVCRYICELRDATYRRHKYGKVGPPTESDRLFRA